MSLAAAAVACGISYRVAWGLLRRYENRLGAPRVVLKCSRAPFSPASPAGFPATGGGAAVTVVGIDAMGA